MDKKELYKEQAKRTVKYVQAHERVSATLKRCFEIRDGEELPVWTLTKESWAELDSAIKNEETALTKLREIMEKIGELSS